MTTLTSGHAQEKFWKEADFGIDGMIPALLRSESQ
jgi:hypothetical protein